MSVRRRPAALALASRLALIAPLLVVAALPAGVAAQVPTPDEDPAPGDVTITIVDQTLWVDPDGTIEVELAVDGAPDGAEVVFTVHERAGDQTAFDRTVSREQLAGRLLGPESLGTIAELDGDTITARVPIRSGPPDPEDPDRLGILTGAGVHPIDIAVLAPDGTRLAEALTHVVRLPLDTELPKLGVVLVVPVTAPPSVAPDGTTRPDPNLRPALRVLATSLLDHSDLPVTLSITPEVLLPLTGSDQPLDALLLEDLAEIAGQGTLTESAFVEVDVDAMARAGLDEETVALIDRGRLVTAGALGRSPAAGWWYQPSDLTPAALDVLAAAGMNGLIVDAASLADAPDATGSVTDLVRLTATDGEVLTALVTDPDLATHQGSTTQPGLDADRLLANLAVRHLDAPSADRSVTVVVDPFDPLFLDALLAGLADSPLLEVRAADDALAAADDDPDTAPVDAAPAPGATDLDLTAHRRALASARAEIRSYRSVFQDASEVEADLELRLAVASSAALAPTDRERYTATIPAELDERLSGIDLPGRRTVTLPARDGTVPITLSNATSEDATIALVLESDKLDFPDGERIELTLPEGITNHDVTVRVRSSGAFPLIISVESPDGAVELADERYTVRSTAVSGLGVGISVVAVVMLVVWWVRTARRARATRHPVTPG